VPLAWKRRRALVLSRQINDAIGSGAEFSPRNLHKIRPHEVEDVELKLSLGSFDISFHGKSCRPEVLRWSL
jgi:hypothetical protein